MSLEPCGSPGSVDECFSVCVAALRRGKGKAARGLGEDANDAGKALPAPKRAREPEVEPEAPEPPLEISGSPAASASPAGEGSPAVDECFRLAASATRKGKGKSKGSTPSIVAATSPQQLVDDAATREAIGEGLLGQRTSTAEQGMQGIQGEEGPDADLAERFEAWMGDAGTCAEGSSHASPQDLDVAVEKTAPLLGETDCPDPTCSLSAGDDAAGTATADSADNEEAASTMTNDLALASTDLAAEDANRGAAVTSQCPEPCPEQPVSLEGLSVASLKALARARGVSVQGCFERADLVATLQKAAAKGPTANGTAELKHPVDDTKPDVEVASADPGVRDEASAPEQAPAPKAPRRAWKPAFGATRYVPGQESQIGYGYGYEDPAPIAAPDLRSMHPMHSMQNYGPTARGGAAGHMVCWDFKQGQCRKGRLCKWIHA